MPDSDAPSNPEPAPEPSAEDPAEEPPNFPPPGEPTLVKESAPDAPPLPDIERGMIFEAGSLGGEGHD